MKMRYVELLMLAALVAPNLAKADTYTLDLTSRDLIDSQETTALWDSTAGRIQAAYSAGSTAGKELDFGDGSDGAFAFDASNPNPVRSGITLQDANTALFDTDGHPNFQFTSFTLGAGKVIKATGSGILTIRVLGAASIQGQILSEGVDGADNVLSGGGTPQGGSGSSNGGNGGNGGSAGSAGSSGLPLAAGRSNGGGPGSAATSATNEGGGGGCLGTAGGAPDNANDATDGWNEGTGTGVGNQGTCTQDRVTIGGDFETAGQVAGAGGGGGGSCGGTCTPANVSGAAGGGGGGRVRITSLGNIQFLAGGKISVKGGLGGDAPSGTVDYGGAGGGGSGGSVWLQTPGTVTGATATHIDIAGGTGGIDGTTAAPGGNGSRGIFRADTQTGSEDGVTVAVNPVRPGGGILDGSATVGVAAATYVAVTKPFPVDGILDVDSMTYSEDPSCTNGAMRVYLEGSGDGVEWTRKAAADVSDLKAISYMRMRVEIDGAGANSKCLTGLSVTYGLANFADLQLKGGLFCGTTSDKGGRSDPRALLGDLGMLFTALMIARTRVFRRASAAI